jgi:hypothetical protein
MNNNQLLQMIKNRNNIETKPFISIYADYNILLLENRQLINKIEKLQNELLNSKIEYGSFTSIDSSINNLQIKNDYFKKK